MILSALLVACGRSIPAPVLPPPKAIESGKTNVVLVLLDTVRADHLGLYGYPVPTSPKLDAFAETSVVFEQHIANSSWTRPSMGSLLTGQYARTLGLYEERFDALDGTYPLLSERFLAQGYTTLGVTSNPNLNEIFGFAKGWTGYGESGVVFRWMDSNGTVFNKGHPMEDATVMTDRAIAMLDAHVTSGQETAFFLEVVYIDPHWPYTQPPEHEAAVKGSRKPGYDGGIHFIDTELDRLLNTMRDRGLMRDTLVVITGDHGEGLWDHGFPNTQWHGNTLYESVLHVPLLLSHPTLDGHRVEELTQGIDLVPTLIDLLGWPVPADLPGTSLARTVHGQAPPPSDRLVFSETDFRINEKVSVRTATHKLIRNDDAVLFAQGGAHEGTKLEPHERQALKLTPPEELYAMGSEVEKPRNAPLSDPALAAELRAAIEAWEIQFPARPPHRHDPEDVITLGDGSVVGVGGDKPVELDEATRRALQAIGYLD